MTLWKSKRTPPSELEALRVENRDLALKLESARSVAKDKTEAWQRAVDRKKVVEADFAKQGEMLDVALEEIAALKAERDALSGQLDSKRRYIDRGEQEAGRICAYLEPLVREKCPTRDYGDGTFAPATVLEVEEFLLELIDSRALALNRISGMRTALSLSDKDAKALFSLMDADGVTVDEVAARIWSAQDEPKSAPDATPEPLPEIAPCVECGTTDDLAVANWNLREYHVTHMGWPACKANGLRCSTEAEAIALWNAAYVETQEGAENDPEKRWVLTDGDGKTATVPVCSMCGQQSLLISDLERCPGCSGGETFTLTEGGAADE